MTIVLQQGINRIVLGSLCVPVALELTLVYGMLAQVNFAHADIVTLGAFSAHFFMHGLGVPSIVAARGRWHARVGHECRDRRPTAEQGQRTAAADRDQSQSS
jgi:ABC-type branched-subunit amino acid transport system permease subunit